MFIKGIISSFTSSKSQIYKEGDLLAVMDAKKLLAAGRHQAILHQLKDICGLPEEYFDAFYMKCIRNFVEFVQVLPIHFDDPLCGIMNEGIARAMIALQTYQTEHARHIDPLRSYAIFTAALFQDISHILINQRVLLTDESGNFIDHWNPLAGSMVDKTEYYRLIRLGPVYQRLDYTLRHLFARQLMPLQAYYWIASDFHLLADWFDAINGDDSQGGMLAHILSLLKHADIVALENSLVQIPVKERASPSTEHGLAFYHWLEDQMDRGMVEVNTANSGLHITEEGLFIEREKLFRDFVENYNQPVSLNVVYEQFGNLMGIVKKGGYDYMNAQYFSDLAGGVQETATRTFGSPISGKQSSLRDGMVLADPSMVLKQATIPAVSPLLRGMQSKGLTYYDLPKLESTSRSTTPSPGSDPSKR